MNKFIGLLIFNLFVLSGLCHAQDVSLRAVDSFTRAGERNFLTGYPAFTDDGMINMVVEIPAGTNEKWEVKKPSENPEGHLKRDLENNVPRTVKYLPYPFNYGMIPNTLLSREQGGDGDPVDVILLGPSEQQGSVVPVKIIGVVRLVDRGEIDDKVIAIRKDGPMGDAASIQELSDRFHGVTEIIETFFLNYKGPGKMQFKGFSGPKAARALIRRSTTGQ